MLLQNLDLSLQKGPNSVEMHRSTPQSGTWPAFFALTEKRLVHVCTTHAHSNADKSSYAHAQPHTMSKPSNLLTASEDTVRQSKTQE